MIVFLIRYFTLLQQQQQQQREQFIIINTPIKTVIIECKQKIKTDPIEDNNNVGYISKDVYRIA